MNPTMTFRTGKTYGESEKFFGCQELMGKKGLKNWSTKDFQGSETTLYIPVMVGAHHRTFIQTHRMYMMNES